METARIWRGDGFRRICYGNYQHTVTGITIERNRDAATGNVVEITYEVPEEDALGTQPEMGTRTDLLGGVVLVKTTTTPGTGETAAPAFHPPSPPWAAAGGLSSSVARW